MFPGFSSSETFVPIPESFFRQLLQAIDDVEEFRVTLYALWLAVNVTERAAVFREEDFAGLLPQPAAALEKAVQRGTLLRVTQGEKVYYLLNSPRGRAVAEAIRFGAFDPAASPAPVPPPERPNLFRLYEENIGPLTPLLADALKDAEQTYSPEWVAEAIQIAVTRNKRNWRYVEAILKRWKEEGHVQKQTQRGAQETSRKYSEGQFAEYLRPD